MLYSVKRGKRGLYMKYVKTCGLTLMAMCALGVCAYAQGGAVKTITNADIEKYRQERIRGEEEYRQNYARLGMPSPEELDKRDAERQKRMTELSQQLRTERL